MTIVLELAPELEARLRRRADRTGQEVADYVLAVVEGTVQEDDGEERQSEGSAADLFAGRIGLIHGSHEALSQDTGERFAQGLLEVVG